MSNKNIPNCLFKRFVWMRINTIELFKLAKKAKVLSYKPKYLIENPTENHDLLYQFQCILTSADTHFRRLRGDKNQNYGIYIKNNEIIKKRKIKEKDVLAFLKQPIEVAKKIVDNYSDLEKIIATFITLHEHESLHQGQLVVMFRETKVEFPEVFKKAWNL